MSPDSRRPFIMTTDSSAKIEGMAGVSPSTRRGRLDTYMHAHAACTAMLWCNLCSSRHKVSQVQTHLKQNVCVLKTVKANRCTSGHLSNYSTCGSDPSCCATAAHLRCNIQRSANLVKEALSICAEVAGAKVDDLHDGVVFTTGEEDVLRFQVPVG